VLYMPLPLAHVQIGTPMPLDTTVLGVRVLRARGSPQIRLCRHQAQKVDTPREGEHA